MTGRDPATVKLYGRVRRRALTSFLADADWAGSPGQLDRLDRLVDEFCPPRRVGDQLYVDLSVDADGCRPSERVGLTFTPQHLEHSDEREPGRGPLLDALIDAGLCTTSQRELLVEWPGQELGFCERLRRSVLLQRWLDVKLVWTPTVGAHAKAYLGLAARLL